MHLPYVQVVAIGELADSVQVAAVWDIIMDHVSFGGKEGGVFPC